MADLDNQPLHDGYAYFTPDQGRFFIDVQLDNPPYLAHASGVVDGKNIYRIELEAKIWKDIQDALNNFGHTLTLTGGNRSVQFDGFEDITLDIQADWNETNENSFSYIKNKPTILNTAILMDDAAKTMFITSPITNGDGVSY